MERRSREDLVYGVSSQNLRELRTDLKRNRELRLVLFCREQVPRCCPSLPVAPLPSIAFDAKQP